MGTSIIILFVLVLVCATLVVQSNKRKESTAYFLNEICLLKERVEALEAQCEQLQKAIATLNSTICVPADNQEIEAQKRRSLFIQLRESGMSIVDAGKQIGVSETTSRRYEQYRISNNKQ